MSENLLVNMTMSLLLSSPAVMLAIESPTTIDTNDERYINRFIGGEGNTSKSANTDNDTKPINIIMLPAAAVTLNQNKLLSIVKSCSCK